MGLRKLIVAVIGTLALLFALSSPAAARCANGRSSTGAMWLSILHPGVGEYFLKGWGPWKNMPQKKFWLGWIPGFGWPGYLQVVSAIDSADCRVNDWQEEEARAR